MSTRTNRKKRMIFFSDKNPLKNHAIELFDNNKHTLFTNSRRRPGRKGKDNGMKFQFDSVTSMQNFNTMLYKYETTREKISTQINGVNDCAFAKQISLLQESQERMNEIFRNLNGPTRAFRKIFDPILQRAIYSQDELKQLTNSKHDMILDILKSNKF